MREWTGRVDILVNGTSVGGGQATIVAHGVPPQDDTWAGKIYPDSTVPMEALVQTDRLEVVVDGKRALAMVTAHAIDHPEDGADLMGLGTPPI